MWCYHQSLQSPFLRLPTWTCYPQGLKHCQRRWRWSCSPVWKSDTRLSNSIQRSCLRSESLELNRTLIGHSWSMVMILPTWLNSIFHEELIDDVLLCVKVKMFGAPDLWHSILPRWPAIDHDNWTMTWSQLVLKLLRRNLWRVWEFAPHPWSRTILQENTS